MREASKKRPYACGEAEQSIPDGETLPATALYRQQLNPIDEYPERRDCARRILRSSRIPKPNQDRLDREIAAVWRNDPAGGRGQGARGAAAGCARTGWRSSANAASRGFVTATKEVRTESQNWPSSCGCDSAFPLRGSIASEFSQRGSGNEMALKIEGIVDGGMHTQEAVRGARRLESLHLALSPTHRLMRVLGSIVAPDPCS